MPIITVSRETGSLGDEIALLISKKLNLKLITHEFAMYNWLPELAGEYELHMLEESPRFYLHAAKNGITFANFIEYRLKEEAARESLVIQGLGSQIIFAGHPDALNIRITASREIRRLRLEKKYGLDTEEAEKTIELSDRKHRRYISTIYGRDWSDPALYHLSLNTDNISVEDAVEVITHLAELRTGGTGLFPEGSEHAASLPDNNPKSRCFAHPSEEEFSKILDMYNIQWEYEPKTFPIEWDAEGNVKMAFTPDFYLPKFDTYIELTTMEQKYVTEKNKKIRKLKEIHPEININIVFKKDFHTLIKRFGVWHTQ